MAIPPKKRVFEGKVIKILIDKKDSKKGLKEALDWLDRQEKRRSR